MTKKCTLKEAFVEKLLDKYQQEWRSGEDITAETKQRIKDYVTAKMPEDFKENAECITDYSIWHMAKKIRQRENLSKPQRSNRGGAKVSVCEPRESGETAQSVIDIVRDIVARFGYNAVMQAIERLQNETPTVQEQEDGSISHSDRIGGIS
jgi:hypothetical protein